MKEIKRDYTTLTAICNNLGLLPYKNRLGQIVEGVYSLNGTYAPVDLSACAEDETSILKTALRQLSESADNDYHESIERDLQD